MIATIKSLVTGLLPQKTHRVVAVKRIPDEKYLHENDGAEIALFRLVINKDVLVDMLQRKYPEICKVALMQWNTGFDNSKMFSRLLDYIIQEAGNDRIIVFNFAERMTSKTLLGVLGEQQFIVSDAPYVAASPGKETELFFNAYRVAPETLQKFQ